MAQRLLSDLQNFIGVGFWAEDEEEEDEDRNEYYPEESFNEPRSVLEGRSVCDASHMRDRGSVFHGGSVCDSAYGERGDGSVWQGSSVYESVWEEREDGSVCEEKSVCERPTPLMSAASLGRPSRVHGPYQPRSEDPLDVAIAEYFRLNPQAYSRNRGFLRISPGRYLVHGREIAIEFQTGDVLKSLKGEKNALFVKDGPLTQRLDDYLMHKDSTAEYSGSMFQARNAIQTIPKTDRMTFADTGAGYSRIEAMQVAKEQAAAREKAAFLRNRGQLTDNLAEAYEKTIDMKLGKNRAQEVKSLINTTKGITTASNTKLQGTQRITVQTIQGYRSPHSHVGGA